MIYEESRCAFKLVWLPSRVGSARSLLISIDIAHSTMSVFVANISQTFGPNGYDVRWKCSSQRILNLCIAALRTQRNNITAAAATPNNIVSIALTEMDSLHNGTHIRSCNNINSIINGFRRLISLHRQTRFIILFDRMKMPIREIRLWIFKFKSINPIWLLNK